MIAVPPVPGKRGIHLADSTIDSGDVRVLMDWLSGIPWLTQGGQVRAFEEEWAEWLDVAYAVYVNSGSSANLLMYYAAMQSGHLQNDGVAVPAVSWPTTIAPAMQLGLKPVMCDANLDDLGIHIGMLDAMCSTYPISLATVVHTLGVPNDMDAILELSTKHGFMLLEDCCAATGSAWKGQKVGTFGDMSSFSFYFGHALSTIEGGMICTDDPDLHDILLMIRSHGWAKDLDEYKEAELADRHDVEDFNRQFTFYLPGFNVRGNDLTATIGLNQMKKVDYVLTRRKENHALYERIFTPYRDKGWLIQDTKDRDCPSISFLTLAPTGKHRADAVRRLHKEQIETRPLGGGNMSRQPFWTAQHQMMPFPVADRVQTTAFHLPNHPNLTDEDIIRVAATALGVGIEEIHGHVADDN